MTKAESSSPAGTVELEVVFDMVAWGWNRYRDAEISLAGSLRDNGIPAQSTPPNKYPPLAARYYGELNATRAALADLVAVILGSGAMADYRRAWKLIDRWAERKLVASAVIADLTECTHELAGNSNTRKSNPS